MRLLPFAVAVLPSITGLFTITGCASETHDQDAVETARLDSDLSPAYELTFGSCDGTTGDCTVAPSAGRWMGRDITVVPKAARAADGIVADDSSSKCVWLDYDGSDPCRLSLRMAIEDAERVDPDRTARITFGPTDDIPFSTHYCPDDLQSVEHWRVTVTCDIFPYDQVADTLGIWLYPEAQVAVADLLMTDAPVLVGGEGAASTFAQGTHPCLRTETLPLEGAMGAALWARAAGEDDGPEVQLAWMLDPQAPLNICFDGENPALSPGDYSLALSLWRLADDDIDPAATDEVRIADNIPLEWIP